MPKSRSRKSKESRSRSRKDKSSRKRKAGPYALFVKANFHKFYKPDSGRSPKAAFKIATKQLAMAYKHKRSR